MEEALDLSFDRLLMMMMMMMMMIFYTSVHEIESRNVLFIWGASKNPWTNSRLNHSHKKFHTDIRA